jgi:UDP-glucose 4-epimerase
VRVLVTGAAGFLGSHLVERLLTDRHEVTGLDDLSTGRLADLAAARRRRGLSFTRFDVTGDDLPDLVAHDRPEAVVHLAAAQVAGPLGHTRTTVLGAVALLEACLDAGVRKLVLTCGAEVYGRPRGIALTERAGLAPVTAAGAAQVGALAALGACGPALATTALVLAEVYGPRRRVGVVAELARALVTREPVAVPAGRQGPDLVHVDDAVDAVVRALDDRADGRRLHVSSGVVTPLREVHRLLAAAAGVPAALAAAPAAPSYALLDNGGIRRALGWEPTTALAEGLAATLEWARGEWG